MKIVTATKMLLIMLIFGASYAIIVAAFYLLVVSAIVRIVRLALGG